MPAVIISGKTAAERMPRFIFPVYDETSPTRNGPQEQPTSPASASRENIIVPPFFSEVAALLKVPGHIIPTDNPQSPQPTRLIAGQRTKPVIMYDAIHTSELISMKRS